jgi:hypothetical protein
MRKWIAKHEMFALLLGLILISAVVYLPFIRQIGYLYDDWYLMYAAKAYGPLAFIDIFSVDRPARALVIPAYILFGDNPLYYNLSAYAWRVISAFCFLWLLRMLWPRQRFETFLASLLFLIYPGFLSQLNGIDYQSQMVSLAAAMFSIALSVRASLESWVGRRILLIVLAALFGWLYLGLVEYFIGFEYLRAISLILPFLWNSDAWKEKLISAGKRYLPHAFIPLDSIHNNTEMFLSLSFHECSGCYCRQPTLSNLQIGKSTHGAKSLFVHVQMTAKTIRQNMPVLSSGDGMFHSHAHSSNGAVAFFLFRRQFTALRFLGWRVHSQARNCFRSVAISIRCAFLRRYKFVQALIPFVCIGVYSFRQAFNHPRLFSQLDVSGLARNRWSDRYNLSRTIGHYLGLHRVTLLLARIECFLPFGILGPIDRLLGSVKQSHPFFPKSLAQGFYWLYRSLFFRDRLQNLRRRHMLPYQWQQPTQVPRNLHLIHPKPHADKLLWQMQAQIRDQSDNPKQKRHGVRTPSSNRSLATRSLVTLPFVGFKIRFDSAKHLPELGCRQSCQVFDPPVMRAQEGFSYHLFPPLCCAWSAFQQTCKNDTTKTINCESTLFAFLLWRVFFFSSERKATNIFYQLGSVLQSPLMVPLRWLSKLATETLDVLFLAWGVPFSRLYPLLRPEHVLIALGASSLVLFVLWRFFSYWVGNFSEESKSPNWEKEILTVGGGMILAGLIPVIMVNREVDFVNFSRYALASATGVGILVAAAVTHFSQQRLRWTILSALIAISVFTHYGNAILAYLYTKDAREFWWQVSWRVPNFQEGTTLVANYPMGNIQEDYFVWGPANLIYRPSPSSNKGGIRPSLYAWIFTDNGVRNRILAGQSQTYNRKKIIVYPNAQTLLVLSRPSANSCVHLLNGSQLELSASEPSGIIVIAPFSRPERVILDGPAHMPSPTIFGPEPPHGWCFFYEKADLARQRGDWEKVIQLGEQAFDQGLQAEDPIEWMPFLQAYAQRGNLARLLDIKDKMKNADPWVMQQVCQRLSSLPEISPQIQEFVRTSFCTP